MSFPRGHISAPFHHVMRGERGHLSHSLIWADDHILLDASEGFMTMYGAHTLPTNSMPWLQVSGSHSCHRLPWKEQIYTTIEWFDFHFGAALARSMRLERLLRFVSGESFSHRFRSLHNRCDSTVCCHGMQASGVAFYTACIHVYGRIPYSIRLNALLP